MGTLALFSLAVVLLVLQSVLHTLVPGPTPLPALALLAPLYAALSPRWSLPGAVANAFVVGYCFDLVAGAPVGVHALVMPVIAILGMLLGTRVQVRGPFSRVVAAFLFALVYGALVMLLYRLVNAGGAGGWKALPLEAALSAVVAPPFFALLDRLDRRFDRSAVRMGPGGGRRDTGIELGRARPGALR
jgi:rod shape-determining protein MreD